MLRALQIAHAFAMLASERKRAFLRRGEFELAFGKLARKSLFAFICNGASTRNVAHAFFGIGARNAQGFNGLAKFRDFRLGFSELDIHAGQVFRNAFLRRLKGSHAFRETLALGLSACLSTRALRMSSRKVQAHGAPAFQIALKALELYLRRSLLLIGSLELRPQIVEFSLASKHALFAGGTHAHRDFRARPHDDPIFGRETSASASRSGPKTLFERVDQEHVTQKRLQKPPHVLGVFKRIKQTRLVARNGLGRATGDEHRCGAGCTRLGKGVHNALRRSSLAHIHARDVFAKKLLNKSLKVLRGANLCGEWRDSRVKFLAMLGNPCRRIVFREHAAVDFLKSGDFAFKALGGFALLVERGSRHGHSALSGCHVFGSCTALLEQLGQRGGFFIETLAFLIELNRCALKLGINLVAFRLKQLFG